MPELRPRQSGDVVLQQLHLHVQIQQVDVLPRQPVRAVPSRFQLLLPVHADPDHHLARFAHFGQQLGNVAGLCGGCHHGQAG